MGGYRRIRLLFGGSVFLIGSLLQAQESAYVRGDVLVMLRPEARYGAVVADLQVIDGTSTGLHLEREVSTPLRTWLFRFDADATPHAVMLRALRNHPMVQLAQNNHLVKERALPDDPQLGSQWHHNNIGSAAAWDISTGGVTATGDTIVVCIIERSDLNHPDLSANAWLNLAEDANNGTDDDGNGYVDDVRGWNTPFGDDNVYGSNHGTQVAGMIGAVGNNALGVSGANWHVKMMPVAYGGAQEDLVLEAYTYPLIMRRRYNTSNGATGAFIVATNASWGIDGGQPSDSPLWCAMFDTLGAEGVLNCGATANNNVDVDAVGDLPTGCPSEYMVSVTATNSADDRTFSGYGITSIDVGAPGASVFTTSQSGGYGYATANGTSFASPLVAGVIGLLYSAPCGSLMDLVHGDPAAGALYIRNKLFAGVDQVGNLPGTIATGGRINAGASMQLIVGACGPCPSPYGLQVQPIDLSTASLSWQVVTGEAFDLRYRVVGDPVWSEVAGIAEVSYLISGLLPCAVYEFQVRVTCDVDVSDYSASATWTSEGCCNAPQQVIMGFIGDNIASLFWTPIIGAETYAVRYRPIGALDWQQVDGATELFVTIADIIPCTNYEVQVASVCGTVIGSWSPSELFNTSGCGFCVDNTYCVASGQASTSEWIQRVAFNNLDNATGNDGGYGDHTGQVGDLAVGAANTLTLVPGYSTFAYTEWWSVWLDFDQDGLFGTNELVYQSTNGSSTQVLASVDIPNEAVTGVTRLRVAMKYGGNVADACGTFSQGEVEDYCANLVLGIGMEEYADVPVRVYPSPADQELWISFSGGSAIGRAQLDVFDGTGRSVAVHTIIAGRGSLDTSRLSSGQYHFRISNDGRSVGRGRFVVLH